MIIVSLSVTSLSRCNRSLADCADTPIYSKKEWTVLGLHLKKTICISRPTYVNSAQRDCWPGITLFLPSMRFVDFIKRHKEWAIYVSIICLMLILAPVTTIFYLKGGEKALDKSASSKYYLLLFKITNKQCRFLEFYGWTGHACLYLECRPARLQL